MREIAFDQAINEAIYQLMREDKRVLLIGQGVTSPWYAGLTIGGLIEKFGEDRVIDTPISENSITGISAGAGLAGIKPILVFPRMDFMFYAMDQLANHIAKWSFMLGGKAGLPLVIWAIINRGGEQAAQHSQAIQAIFMHIPGFKIVAPSTPYDAKGLLISALRDGGPVLYIDDRWLYKEKGNVPEKMYSFPIGKAIVRKTGKDVTVAANSYMTVKSILAARLLQQQGIDIEVIDLLSLKPLDITLICNSVRKTGKLIIVDGGWKTCGVAAEVSALVSERVFKYLKSPIMRITLPDAPAPASSVLEKKYYPTEKNIISAVKKILR